ncbi:MAG: ABC transporter substrate-binding protein [Chloroflexi bacterium]|nr:ABC transporter substrate-binding protein [Chloroflexota bacterium]
MRRNIFCQIAGLCTVIILLLVSCGPRAVPTSITPPAAATPAAPVPVQTPAAPVLTPTPTATVAEKPKYGGSLNILWTRDIGGFDRYPVAGGGELADYVYDHFMDVDRTKGPFGSGEYDYGAGEYAVEAYGPALAESWKTPEVGIWIFQMRRGVHWALNPNSEASRLMNGREFTADDAVFSVRRQMSPASSTSRTEPEMTRAVTIEKTGPWEVTLKTPVDVMLAWNYVAYGSVITMFVPPEVIQKYGDLMDWRNVVGTGPFMITDYTKDSVTTFTRNPNYWRKDPLGPGKGNQLPYVDNVKIFVIPDVSTRLAAMRTGRGDWTTDVELEDATSLLKTTPRLKSRGFVPIRVPVIGFRLDKPDLPFKNKRVRHALTMAIDFQGIKKDLYRGQAEILTWPALPSYKDLHVPMEKLPEAVQALYQYDPAKAKQLLAEAGYPNGFKTKMIVPNVAANMAIAEVVKAQWAKVGVDLELQPRENAVFTSITTAPRSWEEMVMNPFTGVSFPQWLTFLHLRGQSAGGHNPSGIDVPPGSDPVVEKTYQEILKNVIVNTPESARVYRELVPYLLEQMFVIGVPVPYSYTIWQPWVKGYEGEIWHVSLTSNKIWAKYMWIDQDMKETMTGRR